MRLYFTDGLREAGIDTKNEIWCDEKAVKFMHREGMPHRFLTVDERQMNWIFTEIDFNDWMYSEKGLDDDALKLEPVPF